MDPRIKAGIFAGESGGDYNALFGFSNRPGGQFANTRLTDMTVDQAIDFANPRGPYAQWVKGQIGRVATPMGGFQVVGSTLKQAKDWAGLSGSEVMTPEVQDRIGNAILAKQGTGAWEGYRGPRTPAAGPMAEPQASQHGQAPGVPPLQPAPQQNAGISSYMQGIFGITQGGGSGSDWMQNTSYSADALLGDVLAGHSPLRRLVYQKVMGLFA